MFIVSAAIWALTDDRAGHNAHTLGVADSLGIEYEQKNLRFSTLSVLPNCMQNISLRGLHADSRAQISAPWPAVVIASGRRMLPIMRYIKQQSPKTKLVQCLWPGTLEPFNTIAAPKHDKLPDDSRIITYKGALHSLSRAKLDSAAITFQSLFDALTKPHYGLMVGGNSGRRKATLNDLHHMIDTAEFLVKDGSLIITTSRRTPKKFIHAIKDRLTCEYHLHDWGGSAQNPYHGMLALCDALIVSGDSISMASEACFTGKPVLIDTGFSSMRDKHHICCEEMFSANNAVLLRADIDVSAIATEPLNELQRIAPLIKQNLGL